MNRALIPLKSKYRYKYRWIVLWNKWTTEYFWKITNILKNIYSKLWKMFSNKTKIIKLKESEKKDKYLDLARELKKLCNMKVTIMPIVIGAFVTVTKGTGTLGGRRTSGDQPNYNIIEIGQNTEKSLGDLRRLAITQTPTKDHQLKLMWKTLKKKIIIIIIIIIIISNRTTKSSNNQNVRRKGNLQILGDIGSWHDQTTGNERKKIKKEYLRRARKLLEAKIFSRNTVKGINTWVVSLVRYSGPFLK